MSDRRSNGTLRGALRLVFAASLLGSCSCKKDEGQVSEDASDAAAGSEVDAAKALPAAEDLLAKALQASGGKERFESIESFHQEGQISIPGQNIAGEARVWWKNGDFYTEHQMVGIGLIQAGKQGDVVWSRDPIHGLRQLEGREAEQAQWEGSLSLVADWDKHFGQARTTAERIVDGRKVYDVTLSNEGGAAIVMGFDAETGLQVQQSFTNATPGGDIPVTLTFEDYREVDGVRLSHRQVIEMSLARLIQDVTKIEFGVAVDESRFAMPRGGSEVVEVKDGASNDEEPARKTAMPFGPDGKPGRPVPAKPTP